MIGAGWASVVNEGWRRRSLCSVMIKYELREVHNNAGYAVVGEAGNEDVKMWMWYPVLSFLFGEIGRISIYQNNARLLFYGVVRRELGLRWRTWRGLAEPKSYFSGITRRAQTCQTIQLTLSRTRCWTKTRSRQWVSQNHQIQKKSRAYLTGPCLNAKDRVQQTAQTLVVSDPKLPVSVYTEKWVNQRHKRKP